MSLPALALLFTATGALREVAPDWLRVEMAPREPLDMAATGRQALVAIFVGDETRKVRRNGRGWLQEGYTVELAVQVLLPPEITTSFQGTADSFDCRGAGADVVFATVIRLLEIAFMAPDPGAWGELWQQLVTGHPGDWQKLPFLAELADKTKIAAIDVSIPCGTIPSPALGFDPPAFWPALVAKMRDDALLGPHADYVAALVAGKPLPLWKAELALAGLSLREGQGVGLGTFSPLTDTPPIDGFQIDSSPVGTVNVTQDNPDGDYGH